MRRRLSERQYLALTALADAGGTLKGRELEKQLAAIYAQGWSRVHDLLGTLVRDGYATFKTVDLESVYTITADGEKARAIRSRQPV